MQNETSFSAILAKRYLDKVNIHPFIFPFNPDLPARGIYFPKKKKKKVFTEKHQVNAAVSVTTFAIICKPTK